jgi:hypothetical protein
MYLVSWAARGNGRDARLMQFICKRVLSVTSAASNNNVTSLLFIFTPMLKPSTLLVMQQQTKPQPISLLLN